jgi:alanyl-tRNA synthetase
MRNHTGTHLLHRALRNVVGDTARQAGSLVDPAYLRFDYPFDRALTDDEKRAIEDEVRAIVRDDRPLTVEYLPMAEAIERGADAFFDEKYGETVRTVRVKDYSFELCGGTHCRATGQIGSFVITGERSIGSGQRRIEALTGAGADRYIRERLETLDQVAEDLGAQSVDRVPERIGTLQQDLREAKRRAREGGGGVPKPAELAARAEEVAPGAKAVIASSAVCRPVTSSRSPRGRSARRAAGVRRWRRGWARNARGWRTLRRRSATRSRDGSARGADGVLAPDLATRGGRGTGRLHRARRRYGIRQGARLRDR